MPLAGKLAPRQEAEASELAERLRAALPHLSQDQAAVFCLSCLENLSYHQIGERLGMTANAVGVIIASCAASVKRAFGFGRYRNKRRRLRVTNVEDRQNNASRRFARPCYGCARRVRVPPGPPPEVVGRVLDAGLEVHVVPLSAKGSAKKVQSCRIARIALAASLLVAAGIGVSCPQSRARPISHLRPSSTCSSTFTAPPST